MGNRRNEDSSLIPLEERVADFIIRKGESAPPSTPDGDELAWLARARRIHRNRQQFRIGATAALVAAVVALAGFRLYRPGAAKQPASHLTYQVDDAEPPASGYVLVPESVESVLSFSDGSAVKMAPRTRGRVVEVSDRGARFALESGKVSVHVVQRPRTHWLIEAGPFSVTVHGTAFTISWNPVEAVFEMNLATGAVTVSGPVEGSEVQMRAGQTLRVSLRDQTTIMGTGAGIAGQVARAGSPSAREPAEAPGGPEATQAAPLPRSASARWSNRNWKTALAAGKTAAVVSEADRLGISLVLEQADGEDLWALANAARVAGRPAISRQALEAQRRRFPASDRAREAAFFLGRLHDGAADEPQEALRWYDRYLADAPKGLHASDALGRKMTILQRSERRDEALTVARDYLRRFPNETYAKAARALVRAHQE